MYAIEEWAAYLRVKRSWSVKIEHLRREHVLFYVIAGVEQIFYVTFERIVLLLTANHFSVNKYL